MDPETDPVLLADVRLRGYLRKQKSRRRRYFVLCCASERGPSRLEYYESEKKFRAGGLCSCPRKTLPLQGVLTISKRADARHQHLVVLSGRQGSFGVAAENAEQQQMWYSALVELHSKGVPLDAPQPGPAFKEVWQVSLRPRGLGHTRNLAGVYLLCLTEKTIDFVRLNSEEAAIILQLLSIRRCGHSENYFFMEVGRSAVTGPGELWMQVEDPVVAQNMHETILEAMKALSEGFRVRGRSQPLASTPISVPSRRQHLGHPPPARGAIPWRSCPDGTSALGQRPTSSGQKENWARKPDSLSDYSAVSSDESGSSPGESRPPSAPDPLSSGGVAGELDYVPTGPLACLRQWPAGSEASKRASLPPLALEKETPSLLWRRQSSKPTAVSASYPEGLNLRGTEPGYMAMLPGVAPSTEDRDYVPMTPGSLSPPRERGGYMLMSPSRSCSPDGLGLWGPGGQEGRPLEGDYMSMSPLSPSASSPPPEYSQLLPLPGHAPFFSLPRLSKHDAKRPPGPWGSRPLSCSSSTSLESLEESRGQPPLPPANLPSIAHRTGADAGNVALRAAEGRAGPLRGRWQPGSEAPRNASLAEEAPRDSGLNYVDLDLAKEAMPDSALPSCPPPASPVQARLPHPYASIDFQRSGELQGSPEV